ncbi:sterol carrier family protein [Rhodococcus sp. NPDC058521]|uniref:sterol carrier family protein n=1 Tax=Rhodococcus sp. NPDC058521 TaxID=3346536 RepID=UPI0036525FF3
MPPRRAADPAEFRAAIHDVADWLRNDEQPRPPRDRLAAAVRLSARTLEQVAPGSSVEVRVPPFVAVQCIEGPRHTRGTPPNVVETDPRTWLSIVTGLLEFDAAVGDGRIAASGSRASDIAHWLPLLPL